MRHLLRATWCTTPGHPRVFRCSPQPRVAASLLFFPPAVSIQRCFKTVYVARVYRGTMADKPPASPTTPNKKGLFSSSSMKEKVLDQVLSTE